MIREVQDIDSITFTNGKKINLNLLKNQIDRRFLKIMMLVNKIQFPLPEKDNVESKELIKTNVSSQTLTYQEQNESANLKQINNVYFNSKNTPKERKLRAREDSKIERKYNFQQQEFIIYQQNIKEKQDFKQKKNQTAMFSSCVQQTIPKLMITQKHSEILQSQLCLKLSPIKFSKTSRTDRTTLNNTLTTTMRSFQKNDNISQNRIIISEKCIQKMLAQAESFKQKNRKDASQNNIRNNVLKKIEEKFKFLI